MEVFKSVSEPADLFRCDFFVRLCDYKLEIFCAMKKYNSIFFGSLFFPKILGHAEVFLFLCHYLVKFTYSAKLL